MSGRDRRPRRSWLLVPASKPGEIRLAAGSGADVIVLDFAEFVADRDKVAARESARVALESLRESGAELFAQIDPAAANVDLCACAWPGLAGIVVNRAESGAQIDDIHKRLNILENERGIRVGSVALVAALETARGNQDAYAIATASPRVCAITLGRADLVMDLRPEPSGELHLMPYLMQRLVTIAGAAGVVPVGAWWRAPDRGLLATPENTLCAAQRGRAIGFQGALCVRASQVDALNRAYG